MCHATDSFFARLDWAPDFSGCSLHVKALLTFGWETSKDGAILAAKCSEVWRGDGAGGRTRQLLRTFLLFDIVSWRGAHTRLWTAYSSLRFRVSVQWALSTQMDRVSTQAPCDWVENRVSERFDAQLQVIAQPCHELADSKFHLYRNHTEREDKASGLAAVMTERTVLRNSSCEPCEPPGSDFTESHSTRSPCADLVLA